MSSNKSTEDLLGLLQGSEDTEQLDDVQCFIRDMEMEHSDTEKVHAVVVYWFYMIWKANGGGQEGVLLNRNRFFRKLSKYFQRGRHRSVFYKIKKEKFLVSRAERKLIKADFKAERKRITWRKRKEAQRKKQGLRVKETSENTQD